MPMFEYSCRACSKKYERILAFNEAQHQWCDCGEELDMLTSAPAWFKPGKYGKGGVCTNSIPSVSETGDRG